MGGAGNPRDYDSDSGQYSVVVYYLGQNWQTVSVSSQVMNASIL